MKSVRTLSSRRLVIYAIAALLLIAIVVAALSYFHRPTTVASAPAPIPVTAALAERQDVPEIVNAIGTVQSIDSVSVQAQVNGPIIKVEFTPGQDVKRGQELFLIDPRPYQAALDVQQAQLSHDEGVLAEAQVDLTRYQILAQQNSIAKQQSEDQVYVVQQDKGTVSLDQANVETAQLNLAYCHVVAPITGRAGALLVDLGNLVGPSSSQGTSSGTATATGGATSGTMVMIAQIKPIYVSFNVPQIFIDEIKHNQAAAPLEVYAYSQAGKLIEKGKVSLIDNQINTTTGTVLLQATFGNADAALWPGEFVRVRLTMAIRKNVATVPQAAVMAGPNGSYVYVINSDNTVHRVKVQVTDRQDGIAVIAKGFPARSASSPTGSTGSTTTARSRCGRRPSRCPPARPAPNEYFRSFHSPADCHDAAHGGDPSFWTRLLRITAGRRAAQCRFPDHRGYRAIAGREPHHDGGDRCNAAGKRVHANPRPVADDFDQRPRADYGHAAVRSDRNIDGAAGQVQKAINAASGLLPKNLPKPPTYRKTNPADRPILIYAVHSDAMPTYQLDTYANTILAQSLSTINGVGQVSIGGEQEPAVAVQVDPEALASRGSVSPRSNGPHQRNPRSPKGELEGPAPTVHAQYQRSTDGSRSVPQRHRGLPKRRPGHVQRYRRSHQFRAIPVQRRLVRPQACRIIADLSGRRRQYVQVVDHIKAIAATRTIDTALRSCRSAERPVADIRASVSDVESTLVSP